jgi:hypothetical protein
MTLKDAVERLEELDGEDVIYVRRPWSPAAECQTARYDPSVTTGRQRDGMDYFLEAGTAREALAVFDGRASTLDERLRLLIYYAENDAFPDWVYE